MKKVLIIANLFHASPRIPGLTKYLREYGWESIILTPRLGKNPEKIFGGPDNDFLNRGVTIVETDYRPAFYPIKKLFGISSQWEEREELKKNLRISNEGIFFQFSKWLYYHIIEGLVYYPDPEKSWQIYAMPVAKKILDNEHIDTIISSSSPIISHIIAKNLKEQYQIPWVADLRDLWSQNHNYPFGKLRKFFDFRLERDILSKANAIVTVSPLWAEQLSAIYSPQPIYSITNGFDPETMQSRSFALKKKFTIIYTGQIYSNNQNPCKLLEATQALIAEGVLDKGDIEILFYGPVDYPLAEAIKTMNAGDYILQKGSVPRTSAIQAQRESHVLLLLNWEDRNEKGWYPLKIFEYLAAQRPILATGGFGGDVVDALLNETSCGVNAVSVTEIKDAIRSFYSEYRMTGSVQYYGDLKKIQRYSYSEMAKKFSEILNEVSR